MLREPRCQRQAPNPVPRAAGMPEAKQNAVMAEIPGETDLHTFSKLFCAPLDRPAHDAATSTVPAARNRTRTCSWNHWCHQKYLVPRVRAKTIEAAQCSTNSYGRPVHTQPSVSGFSATCLSSIALHWSVSRDNKKCQRWTKHLRTNGCRHMSHRAQNTLKIAYRQIQVCIALLKPL